ncbi:MAG: hypothetical protein KGZ59_06725 [Chitinophagaceae bacterium]|nr:hypothetical protein [Chitinophagaceae bacterium]
MKTTLIKICIVSFLFLTIACSNKAFVHSDFENEDENYLKATTKNKIINQNTSNTSSQKANNVIAISTSGDNSATAYASASANIVSPAILKKTNDIIFNNIEINNLSKKDVVVKSFGADYKSIAVPTMYSQRATELAEFTFDTPLHTVFDISMSSIVTLQKMDSYETVLAKLSFKESLISLTQHQFLIDGLVYVNALSPSGQYISKDCSITLHLN